MAEESDTTLHSLQLLVQSINDRIGARLDSIDANMERLQRKTDALHHIVAGDGHDTSLVLRVTLAETRLGQLELELAKRCQEAADERTELLDEVRKRDTRIERQEAELRRLHDTLAAWRNKAAGAALALSATGGGAALFIANLLGLFK